MKPIVVDKVGKGTLPRNCYCGFWEKNPEYLESQKIPHGFCGICELCSQPGHLRHAPGAAPYTGAWCDSCYRVIAIRNNFRMLLFLIGVAVGVFAIGSLFHWFSA